MAADLSGVSITGWTTLLTNLAPVAEDVIGNRLEAVKLNPGDLAVSVPPGSPFTANLPSEVRQTVDLFARGFGAALGTNKKLGHWATALLLRDMLTAYVNTHGGNL